MDKDQAQPVKRTGLFGWLRRLKTLTVVFSMVGLVASNIAAVLHAGFYDLLMMGIQKTALIVGSEAAETVASRSKKAEVDKRVREETSQLRSKAEDANLKRATAEHNLETERAKLKQVSAELDTERANLKKVSSELDGVNGRITKMKPALQARLAKGVSRNLAAIPAESIPYIGVGVILAVTAADLVDACETMKDFNSLLIQVGAGEKEPDLCGSKVPSKEEVWSKVKKDARAAYQKAKGELDTVQVKVPEFRSPNPP